MGLTRDDFEDMKQLMEAVVRQNNKVLIDEMNERFEEQDEKLDEILTAVGDDLVKHTAKLDDHEDRLRRLERKAA